MFNSIDFTVDLLALHGPQKKHGPQTVFYRVRERHQSGQCLLQHADKLVVLLGQFEEFLSGVLKTLKVIEACVFVDSKGCKGGFPVQWSDDTAGAFCAVVHESLLPWRRDHR